MTIAMWVSRASSVGTAIPKSVSRRCGTPRPVGSTSRLPGFTSRCTIPAACTASSAWRVWSTSRPIQRGGSAPYLLISCDTEPPATNGIVNSTRSSTPAHDCGVTTWVWSIRNDCSRTNRSSIAASLWCSTLAAFTWPSVRSSTRQTVPMPPEAIGSISS